MVQNTKVDCYFEKKNTNKSYEIINIPCSSCAETKISTFLNGVYDKANGNGVLIVLASFHASKWDDRLAKFEDAIKSELSEFYSFIEGFRKKYSNDLLSIDTISS